MLVLLKKNTKIGMRIGMAPVPPAVGMLAFSGLTAFDKYQTSTGMFKVLELSQVAPATNDLTEKSGELKSLFETYLGEIKAA